MSLGDHLTLPCGRRLKNRLAKAAMTEGLADGSNGATPALETLYRRWAAGGPGLLLTGNIMIDRRYLERPGNVAIDGEPEPAALAALSAFARAGAGDGVDIWAQLSHAGRQTPKYVASTPVGPSAVPVRLPGGQFGAPRALERDEIDDVIRRFAHAARVAKSAGFGGVQVHAAHGYLISEFLSPLVNQRDDEWGGSLENRARLLIAVIRAVRAQVGGGYPVSVKLNSSDFQKGGFSFEDCLEVVSMLNDEAIDLLEISGGNYEQPRMMGMEGLEPVFEEPVRASTRSREAYFLRYAEAVAERAAMPLMVTGGFRSRAAMEEALASGGVDVIGVARPLCVAPDAPKALLHGSIDALPDFDAQLRLGPGILGPASGIDLVKALNGFAAMAFYYQNIIRLSEGRAPKERMALLPAFARHMGRERSLAKALSRAD